MWTDREQQRGTIDRQWIGDRDRLAVGDEETQMLSAGLGPRRCRSRGSHSRDDGNRREDHVALSRDALDRKASKRRLPAGALAVRPTRQTKGLQAERAAA